MTRAASAWQDHHVVTISAVMYMKSYGKKNQRKYRAIEMLPPGWTLADLIQRLDVEAIGAPWLKDFPIVGRQSPTGLHFDARPLGDMAGHDEAAPDGSCGCARRA